MRIKKSDLVPIGTYVFSVNAHNKTNSASGLIGRIVGYKHGWGQWRYLVELGSKEDNRIIYKLERMSFVILHDILLEAAELGAISWD